MQVNSVGNINSAALLPESSQTRNPGVQQAQAVALAIPTQTESAVQATAASERLKLPSAEETKDAVSKLNDLVKATNQSLQFSVDEDTNIKLVKLIDLNTKETIRQFPSEEVVNIARAIDKFQGMLVRDRA